MNSKTQGQPCWALGGVREAVRGGNVHLLCPYHGKGMVGLKTLNGGHVISMSSACHQHVTSMSACHQHVISMSRKNVSGTVHCGTRNCRTAICRLNCREQHGWKGFSPNICKELDGPAWGRKAPWGGTLPGLRLSHPSGLLQASSRECTRHHGKGRRSGPASSSLLP